MIDGTEFTRAAAALEAGFAERAPAIAADELDAIGLVVQDNVRARARRHRRTGRLERQVSVHATGQGASRVVRVHAGGRVAHLITGGTRSHAIRALPGHVLDLAGTAIGFARAIRHPGTRADPFVAEGIADSQAQIEGLGDAAVDELASDLAAAIARS